MRKINLDTYNKEMLTEYSDVFIIDSNHRINGDESDFTFMLDIPKDRKYDNVVVLGASIPKSFYIVSENHNEFDLEEDGLLTTIRMPLGNYSIDVFMDILKPILDAGSIALGHNYVYTISTPEDGSILNSPSTGKLTFSVSNNGGIQPSIICNSTHDIYQQLGFRINSVNTFIADTITSSTVVRFQKNKIVYIKSDIVNQKDGILQEVYSHNTTDYSYIIYQCTNVELNSRKINNHSNNTYKFTLVDNDDLIVNLNGINIVFTICLYKKNNTPILQKNEILLNQYKKLQK